MGGTMFSRPKLERIVCLAMALVFPASMMLGETKAAMAMASGAAALNRATLLSFHNHLRR